MRPVIGVAAMVLLGLTACSAGGTPSPSSVTITPSLHRASSSTTATRPAGSVRPSNRLPQSARESVLLTADRVGRLGLGVATPVQASEQLDPILGAPTTKSTCGGAATTQRWGALTMTFAGTPAMARTWEVDLERGTAHLRLSRGTEWRPELDGLLERPDATVTTSGSGTAVTLAGGLTYRFGKDRDAHTVGAGTPACR